MSDTVHKGTKVTTGAVHGLVTSHPESPRWDDHPDPGLHCRVR